MSVEKLIDTMTEWAQANICDHIKLKQPPANENAPVDEGYKYTLVNPVAFPMYVPTPEKLPPNVHSPFPSLCVRFVEGEDAAARGEGAVDVQFCFSAWNPGLHGQDTYTKSADGTWSRNDAVRSFQRNAEGWRDLWQFVDIALRAIESENIIGCYTIDRATPIKFGPLTEQESIPDFYPFWFAVLSFRVTYPLMRNIPDVQEML